MTMVATVSEAVQTALGSGRGVTALESTLIAQGLPWPANFETAQASEAAVRAAGAIPATIAVWEGTARIGLTTEELQALAQAPPGVVRKANRRDLAGVIAYGQSAATTVSATLFLARSCGIRVMATGGLGGVHRDWTQRPDISNDLAALADARGMVVVCSGFKSILDLPATMEILETLGVSLVGYQTRVLPTFLTRESDVPLDTVADTPEDLIAVIRAHRRLNLPGALIVAHPVPADNALDPAVFDHALQNALEDARAQAVIGKPLTPFLLDRIRRHAGDQALIANQSLIIANAALAGTIAKQLSDDDEPVA